MKMHTRIAACALTIVFCAGCVGPDPMNSMEPLPSIPGKKYTPPSRPERSGPGKLPDAPKSKEPLSLSQCMSIAIHNNSECQIALRRARAAGARVGQALSRYWPQIDFSATSQRIQSQVLTEVDARFLRSTHRMRVQASQTLYEGGAREASLKAARAGRRASGHRYSGVLQKVALETAVAYFRLLAAQSRLEVAQDTVKQRDRHLQLAQKKVEAGLGRPVEVHKARARKANAKLTLTEQKSAVRQRSGELASAMAVPVNSTLNIQDVGVHETRETQLKIEELLEEAAANRPQLQTAISQVRQARKQVEVQEARRWPTLNLNTSYGGKDTHLLPEEREEWTVSLGLSLPLFTGFQNTYRISEARETLHRKIASYEDQLTSVKLEVWKRYSAMLRAEESITAAEQFLQSARESLKATESHYREGYASIVELIDAQTTLTKARNRKVKARLSWHLAMARLRRAVGKRWPDPDKLGKLATESSTESKKGPSNSGSGNSGQ